MTYRCFHNNLQKLDLFTFIEGDRTKLNYKEEHYGNNIRTITEGKKSSYIRDRLSQRSDERGRNTSVE